MGDFRVPALLLLVAAAWASPAAAHSELRQSVPGHGAVLETAPERIELHFNERVQVTRVRVEGMGIGPVALPDRRVIREAREDTVRLPHLPPGGYRVEWRAISADGHPIGGTIEFAVAAPSGLGGPS